MSRWFRFYDDAMNDPKVLKLSDKLHRVWIGILCAASKYNGELPPLDDLSLMIRSKPEKLRPMLEELIKEGLIDRDGLILKPHNWDRRQFKSDVSTERVKRFRNGKSKVSETPPDTDTELERERDAGAREEILVSREASEFLETIDFAKSILKEIGEDFEEPGWYGFSRTVQCWLNQKIPKDFIFAMCSRYRGKSQAYLNTTVQNSWREKQLEQQTPRKTNGSSSGNIIQAQDRIIEKLAEFGNPIGTRGIRSEAGADDVRLLSKG